MSIKIGKSDMKSDVFIVYVYGGDNMTEPTIRICKYDKDTDSRIDINSCHTYEPKKLMNSIIENSEQIKRYDNCSAEELERKLAVTDGLKKLLSERRKNGN